eukprot:scpid110401/ scgid6942/ 
MAGPCGHSSEIVAAHVHVHDCMYCSICTMMCLRGLVQNFKDGSRNRWIWQVTRYVPYLELVSISAVRLYVRLFVLCRPIGGARKQRVCGEDGSTLSLTDADCCPKHTKQIASSTDSTNSSSSRS